MDMSSRIKLAYEVYVGEHIEKPPGIKRPIILQVRCIDPAERRMVGYVVLSKEHSITFIYVSPGYRRRGIGTQLLRLLLNEAKKLGINFILLKVFLDNLPALKLYRKLNFRFLGFTRRKGKTAAVMGIYLGNRRLIPVLLSLASIFVPILDMLPKHVKSSLLRRLFFVAKSILS